MITRLQAIAILLGTISMLAAAGFASAQDAQQQERMVAAQEAAKTFLRDLPRDIEVGLVTFAGSSQVAQRPTLDRDSLVRAIDGFQMQMGTAVGSAIVV